MPKRRPEPEAALPWERQKGETPQAFEAFSIYRDMGSSRSTAKVGRKLGKSKNLMDRWSSRWEWVERARAYDNDLERQERAEAAKDLKEARKRQRKTGYFMQKKATEALDRLNVEDLDANAIIRLIVEGAKLERGNRLEEAGFLQPTGTPARSGQQGAADGGIDWSKLTDADLRKLASMDGGDDDEEE